MVTLSRDRGPLCHNPFPQTQTSDADLGYAESWSAVGTLQQGAVTPNIWSEEYKGKVLMDDASFEGGPAAKVSLQKHPFI